MPRLLLGLFALMVATPAFAGEAHASMGVGVIVLPSDPPPAPTQPVPTDPHPDH